MPHPAGRAERAIALPVGDLSAAWHERPREQAIAGRWKMDLAKYGPWALVIGGSEGVGAEFARQ